MPLWNSRLWEAIKSLVDNPTRAVNWAGLAYGLMTGACLVVMALWGFGVGSDAAIAALALPFACLIGGQLVISGLVIAANLGFAKINVSKDGVLFDRSTQQNK